VSGWECPDWYAPAGVDPKAVACPSKYSWGKHEWFPFWEAEHKACREGVALTEMTFMGKFLVQVGSR
jgi:4-methylaminobutanoate oxidase (formaldehyde-forming)